MDVKDYIDQTAKDYDMPYWLVEKIYNETPEKNFHSKLEYYRNERTNK